MKYIQTLNQIKVPAVAMTIFEKRSMFIKVRNKLLLDGLTNAHTHVFELKIRQHFFLIILCVTYVRLHFKIYIFSKFVFSSM